MWVLQVYKDWTRNSVHGHTSKRLIFKWLFFKIVNYFNDPWDKNEWNDHFLEFLEAVTQVKRLNNKHSEFSSFSPCSLFPQPVLPLFQQLNLQGRQDKRPGVKDASLFRQHKKARHAQMSWRVSEVFKQSWHQAEDDWLSLVLAKMFAFRTLYIFSFKWQKSIFVSAGCFHWCVPTETMCCHPFNKMGSKHIIPYNRRNFITTFWPKRISWPSKNLN